MKELKSIFAAALYVLATVAVVILKPILVAAQKASDFCGLLAQKKLAQIKPKEAPHAD